MYLEDVEFCRRLADHGYLVACLPSLTAGHAAGSSRRSLGTSGNELDVLAGEVPWLLAADKGHRWQARLAICGALILACRLLLSRDPVSRRVANQLIRWSLGPKPRYIGWRPSFAGGEIA
jgi:GT2 family glycosyltransferase